MLQRARRSCSSGINFIYGDAEKLPVEDASFDAVVGDVVVSVSGDDVRDLFGIVACVELLRFLQRHRIVELPPDQLDQRLPIRVRRSNGWNVA